MRLDEGVSPSEQVRGEPTASDQQSPRTATELPAAGAPVPSRLAVVLVHGMGEQRPMDTIREFVNEYVHGTRREAHMWSVADRYDNSFELHTFVVPAEQTTEKECGKTVIRTTGQVDFYEGYWAADARGTKMWHLGHFAMQVLSHLVPNRTRGRVPWRLAWVWVPLVVMPLLSAFVLWQVLAAFGDTPWWGSALKIAASLMLPLVAAWMTGSLGDVARYLDSNPDNVAARHAIRQNLVGLLNSLHDGGRYRKIILIGHSLGGVVAYDALRLLWASRTRDQDMSELSGATTKLAEAAKKLTTAATSHPQSRREQRRALLRRRSELAQEDSKASADLHEFLEAQDAVFGLLSQPGGGEPARWLVSDLVTIGSPIAYPDLLMTPPGIAMDTLVKERELPTCPPQDTSEQDTSEPEPRNPYTYLSGSGRDPKPIPVFHHAAMFAATRWTNIYAHADFVGNEIPEKLGSGVVNRRLDKDRWSHIPVTSHTRYWTEGDGQRQIWEVINRVCQKRETCSTSPPGPTDSAGTPPQSAAATTPTKASPSDTDPIPPPEGT